MYRQKSINVPREEQSRLLGIYEDDNIYVPRQEPAVLMQDSPSLLEQQRMYRQQSINVPQQEQYGLYEGDDDDTYAPQKPAGLVVVDDDVKHVQNYFQSKNQKTNAYQQRREQQSNKPSSVFAEEKKTYVKNRLRENEESQRRFNDLNRKKQTNLPKKTNPYNTQRQNVLHELDETPIQSPNPNPNPFAAEMTRNTKRPAIPYNDAYTETIGFDDTDTGVTLL